MIRSLLVAYDGSHGARVALQHSVDLASPSQARVVLLTVGGAESDADGLAGNGVDLVALAEDAASDDSLATGNDPDQVVQEAVTVCRDLVVRCVARPAYGDVASALIAGSRLSDLVLVGRDAFESAGGADVAARTARRVAGHAESPVVVTPREYNPVRSVIAACPPSDVGARALRTAAELASILQLNVEALVFG
ncbi:MAG TPA: universal stress protein, partial [Armatimonadota bacterium]|nr:universal stress protein [Armatimonadota bacterium]